VTARILDARCFDPLPDHLTIDIDHGMSTATTVGSGVAFYDGDALMFRGSFASTQLAQDVRTLVVEGHVRKMSVAYMNARHVTDDNGIRHVVSAELLNAAIVPIPSNREADILAAKHALRTRSGSRHPAVTRALIDVALFETDLVLEDSQRDTSRDWARKALADAEAALRERPSGANVRRLLSALDLH
jgi:HK97 family phage prohead protease